MSSINRSTLADDKSVTAVEVVTQGTGHKKTLRQVRRELRKHPLRPKGIWTQTIDLD